MKKNTQMAFLEYSFLFNPQETGWGNLVDFEKDLADFFGSYEIEATIIKTVDGQVGRRILYLEKAEIEEPVMKKEKPLIAGGKQIDSMTKRFNK